MKFYINAVVHICHATTRDKTMNLEVGEPGTDQ
jgi:hypothetical protein